MSGPKPLLDTKSPTKSEKLATGIHLSCRPVLGWRPNRTHQAGIALPMYRSVFPECQGFLRPVYRPPQDLLADMFAEARSDALALLHAGCSSPAQHLDGITSPWRVGCRCLHDITVKSAHSRPRRNNCRIHRLRQGCPSVAPLPELPQDTLQCIL